MTAPRDPGKGEERRFMTTHWTDVLAARGQSPEAKESLRVLCQRYYAPVVCFVQKYTQSDQNAQDWTHAFFAKLLEGRSLDSVLESKGKFRSYLLGAVKHFLADERAKQQACKRGGMVATIHIDSAEEAALAECDPNISAMDAYFDRQWALSILQMSLQELEAELEASQSTRFQLLRPWLSGDPSEQSLAEVGARLGLSAETVKVTIHRWRKRFRAIVKTHIASTLPDETEIDEELRYLVAVLAFSGNEKLG